MHIFVGLLALLLVSRCELALEDEPNDLQVWSAIAKSVAEWKQAKRELHHSHVHRRDEEVVCYNELGCFRDEGPFDYLDTLPLSPEHINTKFILVSRKNRNTPAFIHYSNASSIHKTAFNGSLPVKIIIHGFGSSCRRLWAREMIEALLSKEDMNIICVDWEAGAALPNYVQAAANTRLVGKQVAKLVEALSVQTKINASRFHLIGFSLGAHVAGFTGKDISNISRITGLDPAAPLFESYGSKARLDPADAVFVDVVHSNGDRLLKGGLGSSEPMGHVDYYPNGGKVQAGCNNIFIGAISDLFWYRSRSEEDGRSLCNHRRAYKFFVESIVPECHFRAFSCEDYDKFLRGECFSCRPDGINCGNMGFYADKTPGRGKMYLITRDTEPLCANQFKVSVEISNTLKSTYGSLELILFSASNDFNETFTITGESEEILSEKALVKMIVAHPSLFFGGRIQLRYLAYRGWIYRGIDTLSFDKISITDNFGRTFSFCSQGMILKNKIALSLTLLAGECKLETRIVWETAGTTVAPLVENEISNSLSDVLGGLQPIIHQAQNEFQNSRMSAANLGLFHHGAPPPPIMPGPITPLNPSGTAAALATPHSSLNPMGTAAGLAGSRTPLNPAGTAAKARPIKPLNPAGTAASMHRTQPLTPLKPASTVAAPHGVPERFKHLLPEKLAHAIVLPSSNEFARMFGRITTVGKKALGSLGLLSGTNFTYNLALPTSQVYMNGRSGVLPPVQTNYNGVHVISVRQGQEKVPTPTNSSVLVLMPNTEASYTSVYPPNTFAHQPNRNLEQVSRSMKIAQDHIGVPTMRNPPPPMIPRSGYVMPFSAERDLPPQGAPNTRGQLVYFTDNSDHSIQYIPLQTPPYNKPTPRMDQEHPRTEEFLLPSGPPHLPPFFADERSSSSEQKLLLDRHLDYQASSSDRTDQWENHPNTDIFGDLHDPTNDYFISYFPFEENFFPDASTVAAAANDWLPPAENQE